MGLSARERKALLESLESEDPQERAQAAFGLGDSPARSAKAALMALLDDPIAMVRGAAAYSLWRMGEKGDAASHLIALLGSRDEETKQLAVHALGEMGGDALEALEREAKGRSRNRAAAKCVLAEIREQRDGEPN